MQRSAYLRKVADGATQCRARILAWYTAKHTSQLQGTRRLQAEFNLGVFLLTLPLFRGFQGTPKTLKNTHPFAGQHKRCSAASAFSAAFVLGAYRSIEFFKPRNRGTEMPRRVFPRQTDLGHLVT